MEAQKISDMKLTDEIVLAINIYTPNGIVREDLGTVNLIEAVARVERMRTRLLDNHFELECFVICDECNDWVTMRQLNIPKNETLTYKVQYYLTNIIEFVDKGANI